MSEWISVKDRLPEELTDVLTFSKGFGTRLNYVDDGKFVYDDSHKRYKSFGKVTHWMPLPEPPKEESE